MSVNWRTDSVDATRRRRQQVRCGLTQSDKRVWKERTQITNKSKKKRGPGFPVKLYKFPSQCFFLDEHAVNIGRNKRASRKKLTRQLLPLLLPFPPPKIWSREKSENGTDVRLFLLCIQQSVQSTLYTSPGLLGASALPKNCRVFVVKKLGESRLVRL